MTEPDFIIGTIGAVSSFAAAVFWLWASLIEAPDNIDTFIGELQKIGRMNAYGAFAACIAAFCGVCAFGKSLWLAA
jgi:hypothetical protein